MSSGDFMFHANRMEELYQDVIRGTFIPRISTYTFNQVGSGINFFYPWILLYPFVIFRILFHNPIIAFYLFILFYTYLTIFIAYICMYSYSGSYLRAFIFALLYTFSNYHFYLVWNQNVLAEALAYTFLPIVFLGFYEIFFNNYNQWPLLGIGMTFLIFSHMLTTILSAIVMLIILLVTLPLISNIISRFINAVKAALLSSLLSAFYLVPFYEQWERTKVRGSWLGLMLVQTPFDTVKNALNNVSSPNIGILLLIVVILGAFYLKKSNPIDRSTYYIGLTLLLLTTSLVPWSHLKSTPIAILQFPYRLNGLATLMLSVYLSSIVASWIKISRFKSFYLECLSILASILIIFTLNIDIALQTTDYRQSLPRMSEKQTFRRYLPDKNYSFNITAHDWNNMFGYFGHNGAFDYYPKSLAKSMEITVATHHAWINGNKVDVSSRISKLPNELSYDLSGFPSGSKITLPAIYYFNDVVKTGRGHFQKPQVDNNNLIQIRIPKRDKKVTVKYQDSFIDIASLWISLLSWIGLIVSSFWKKHNLRRKV
ncbi:6-pyruvoyl-tetrahydropterin synthase-related protein [Limosilactobacillus sp.]|uniref:6-pyruvoyl-tetrahydropterin synthase-related protein n=1 Tax=Limosilactobacillus sp. TaxID=2773925 RepID=UPI00345EC0AF